MTLFRNKYRIETTRLRDWNYAAGGWYFVTICIENKRCYFGGIVDAQMDLSVLGKYAEACWKEIPSHHKNVILDEYIVMPNHVHGIIVIDGPDCMPPLRRRGERRPFRPLPTLSPKNSSLGSIMHSYKSAVTTWAHAQGFGFEWQPRFHDRIIRGRNSLENIRQYIRDNPVNWEKDTEFVRDSWRRSGATSLRRI
jgi:REP element-mobilizing transposase RayT